MLPSEILRDKISKRINVDLSEYAWNDKLKQTIFNIKLCKDLEEKVDSLKEIYEYGLNIGHCGLTARYLMRSFSDLELYYGRFNALIGTKNSIDGNHAWVTTHDYIIDTTLMIILPIETALKIGYVPEKKIAKKSAIVLSEYELFSNEYTLYLDQREFYTFTLYNINPQLKTESNL